LNINPDIFLSQNRSCSHYRVTIAIGTNDESFYGYCGQRIRTALPKRASGGFSFSGEQIPEIRIFFPGLTVINIGEVFTSRMYPGVFVPYEIRLSNGEIRKHNLALKTDAQTGRWHVDGGL